MSFCGIISGVQCGVWIAWGTYRLDGDTLGVDGTEIGILKEGDEIRLDRLLQGTDGRGLEAEIGLEVLCNFTHLRCVSTCLNRIERAS